MNKQFLPSLLYTLLLALILPLKAGAVMPWEVRWHNETADTTKITQLLLDGRASGLGNGKLVRFFGEKFIGTPYQGGTLEGTPEMLTVNLDGLDCTTFVETALALTMTIDEGRLAWQDFLHNLENIRYRNGNADGYSSRLHYVSDWIVDNSHRGNIKEVTNRMPGVGYVVKTLDFMTANRSSYPALADSTQFARMKSVEVGYRSHRFPYVKSATLMGKSAARMLLDGDILAFTTKKNGLDVSHMGIVTVQPDGIHLLHASSKAGSVVLEKSPLGEYLKKNPAVTGARIIRLGER